jgi:tRNA-uridine 2-sulfurtransferase
MARVFVAMSGGVDSSVAAALLVQQGHDVTGVTMRLLPGEDAVDGCCSLDGARSAKRVCDAIGIAHYTLEFSDVFEREVIEPYCDEYAAGRTPNPCIVCNDRVKFSELLRRVALQDADFLATGHYARIETAPDGVPRLLRGLDASKDQSYFLYRTTPAQLARTMFPLGEMTKVEVRALARRLGLPTAERPESQETCFVPGDDVRAFVRERRPGAFTPGDIVDPAGRVVGSHAGVAGITVGQRRGLRLSAAEGMFVTSIDAAHATVHVGPRAALSATAVVARDAVWRGGDGPLRVTARVRYRGPEPEAVATLEGETLSVRFATPVDSPAPGQAVVCYDGDVVVGGGVIEEAT